MVLWVTVYSEIPFASSHPFSPKLINLVPLSDMIALTGAVKVHFSVTLSKLGLQGLGESIETTPTLERAQFQSLGVLDKRKPRVWGLMVDIQTKERTGEIYNY